MLPWLILLSLVSILHRLRLGVPIRYAFHPFRKVPFPANPRFVHFYDYVEWDSMRGAEILREELGWTHPPDRPMRFDCDLHRFGNYEAVRTKHISSDGQALCRFIQDGKMAREQTVRQEQAIRDAVNEECLKVIRGLGVRDKQEIW
jgi:hypothetical protein